MAEILLTHSNSGVSSPAALGPAVGLPNGTITGARILLASGNLSDGDAIFDLYIDGVAQSLALTIPDGDDEISVTGLSIAITDDNSAQFRIEGPVPDMPIPPYHFWIYYTPTTIDDTASTTEVLTGTATNKLVTPDSNAALWEQGSDVVSAGTISVGEGGYFNVTGTTTITDIDFGTTKAGRKVWLKFAGILILTHHATTLILPTGANITTAAGDLACFVSEGGDNVRCISYTRADGSALTGSGGFTAASTTEVLTGTDTTKGVTPDSLAAIWEQGSDIASAGTISIGEGGQFNVTGTTTITDIDPATDKAGRTFWLKFAGALTLTHNASTLILPTGANIITVAGDMACFRSEGSDAVRCIAYQRADGTALSGGGGFTAASTTEVLTGTNTTKGVTPDSLAALWEWGADIASASSIAIGEGGYFSITGTTTITEITFTVDTGARKVWVYFTGALTLTHNASTLILPGGANITTATGDVACFINEGGGVTRCLSYTKAATPPVTYGTGVVTQLGLAADGSDSDAIGFRGIPQNAQTGNYTLVMADAGKHIYHASGAGAGDTYTIPANASVAFEIGTAITFVNSATDSVSIAITTDTMTLAGTTTTGTRTLAQNGVATAIKVTTTAWLISGTGLT